MALVHVRPVPTLPETCMQQPAFGCLPCKQAALTMTSVSHRAHAALRQPRRVCPRGLRQAVGIAAPGVMQLPATPPTLRRPRCSAPAAPGAPARAPAGCWRRAAPSAPARAAPRASPAPTPRLPLGSTPPASCTQLCKPGPRPGCRLLCKPWALLCEQGPILHHLPKASPSSALLRITPVKQVP